jgi:peptidoglycan/xylan/chitin deacetylase (PgdA/CDA1 family)
MIGNLDKHPNLSYANTRVLDELQRANTPATFFLASLWVQRYPAVTRRIAGDPRFEIASHSYAHRGFTRTCYNLGTLPPSQMAADVERSFDVLKPYGGHQTRYFRFPGGCYDKSALQAIEPAGCTVIQYSVVAGDPLNHNVKSIEDSVLSKAKPGAIVVMHITEANAPDTDKALPAIIAGLHKRGLQLVTLSDLLGQN